MKKVIAFLLGVISTPVFAASWTYIVYEKGALTYEGHRPPVDLTYPPPGEPTPTMRAGDVLTGTVLTQKEAKADLSKPQLIIIPPSTTVGSKESGPTAILE
jgi:hypothetical protein